MTRLAMDWRRIGLLVLASCMLAACGGSNDNGQSSSPTRAPSPTATTPAATATPSRPAPTATTPAAPSATPTLGPTASAAVNGLVVVDQSVVARGSDHQLGLPPAEWVTQPDAASFQRSLSHADWSVVGMDNQRGETGADGRFVIRGLRPGRYVLQVTKALDGNLAPISAPFAVGSDGSAQVVVEVAWGLVRSVSINTDDSTAVMEVFGSSGTRLVTRAGRITELADPGRTLTDTDGDGHFESNACARQAWECGPERTCDAARVCACTASCPDCEDCGPGVCVPPMTGTPYRCEDDGGCARPEDRCVCVSSCAACDDCHRQVCVRGCDPVDIAGLSIVGGPSQLVLGQQGSLTAVARLTDGSQLDVTQLVTWVSADPAIAAVDSWGTVVANQVGTIAISATLGEFTSQPWSIDVVGRPTLRRIYVQNVSCYYPLGRPNDPAPSTLPLPPVRDDILPVPNCHQVVQIGGTLQFTAFGEFDNGYYQDLTSEVQWQLATPGVGEVEDGFFTARQAGTTQLTAALEGVVSDATEIRVVTEPTVVALSIYPGDWAFAVVDGGPLSGDRATPCFECRSTITVLRGDEVHFRATAQYDTGFWEDVTERVTWRSSKDTVGSVNSSGVLTTLQAGETTVDATLGNVDSNPVDVRVVSEATLQILSIYQEGTDRVLAKGDERFFRATGFYDVGFSRDVTTEATWKSSDETVGGFEVPGVFSGRAAGTTQVSAELAGQRSETVALEVFERGDLTYCDPARVNRGVWSDYFNRVVLESDCATYTQPGVVAVRYTVTETQQHGGIFDPCLDLYVYRGSTRVRTLREEGCGDPFVAGAAPDRDAEVLKYQLRAFWDLKADDGTPVPAGRYTIFGRFYLYYDPVVRIDVVVQGPNGRIPCEPNSCGNGCGYIHACGDTPPSEACPAICTTLCECPPGWGITDAGDCEACTNECCPLGAACPPGVRQCELPCCPPNARCTPDTPPCEPHCCPLGAFCGRLDLPPCEPADCCKPGDVCIPDLPPCVDACCPIDAICIIPLPPCAPSSTGSP